MQERAKRQMFSQRRGSGPKSRGEHGGSWRSRRHGEEGARNRGRFLRKNWLRVAVSDMLLRESAEGDAGHNLGFYYYFWVGVFITPSFGGFGTWPIF